MQHFRSILANIWVILAIAGFTLWYLYQTITASSDIENLIFILPIAIITLSLCTFEAVSQIRKHDVSHQQETESLTQALPSIALFCCYILSLPWLGFDLGTLLFVAAFLWLQGERRVLRIVIYCLIFALALSYFFSYMLPYPMPMFFLATEY